MVENFQHFPIYNPDKMLEILKIAHRENDFLIEQCYQKLPFRSDEERLSVLFKLYKKMINKENIKKEKMPKKNKKIEVKGKEISVIPINEKNYISLTDMLKAKDGDFFISDWLRNRNTVEYLGIWEKIHNPIFNYGEYAIIKNQAGLNSYKISVKEWVSKTKAIGLVAKTGRYGGTYAHQDIAFEFGMWISPEFKIYLVKEFQRLQDIEQKQLGWDIKRNLTKINYKIHTDAIKAVLIPKSLNKKQTHFIYASEADVLNMALFGKTAKQWRNEKPKETGNIRDFANVSQLVCLVNLENFNALFIKENMNQADRLKRLNQIAIEQMKLLTETNIKKLQ